MSYEEILKNVTFEADASLGIYTGVSGMPGAADPNYGKQYCFVKITGADQVGLAVAAGGADEVGVLQNKPQQPGAAATVAVGGISHVRIAAACSVGNLLAPDATGRGVHDATNGRWLVLRPGTAANAVVPCLKVR